MNLRINKFLLILFSLIGLYESCNKYNPSSLKHGKRISCKLVEENGVYREYSEFECDTGYEFKAGITKKSVRTVDGVLEQMLQCNAIGCKLYEMPTKEKVDPKNNLIFKYSICVPAVLENHCLPEKSYVDFECKPGLKLDEQFGFLHVKCLFSYLWDTIPVCNDGTDDEDQPVQPADGEEPIKPTTKKLIQTTKLNNIKPATTALIARANSYSTTVKATSKYTTPGSSASTTRVLVSNSSYSTIYSTKPSTALSTNPSTALSTNPSTTLSTNPSTALSTNPSTTLSTNPSTTLSTNSSTALSTNPSTILSTNPSTTLSTNPSTTLSTNSSTTLSTNPSTSSSTTLTTSSAASVPSTNASTTTSATQQQEKSTDTSRKTTSALITDLLNQDTSIKNSDKTTIANTEKLCSDNYPFPNNYDKTKINYNLISSNIQNFYRPGSKINITCLPGYIVNKKAHSVVTECMIDGTWSLVPNCEINPCWSKIPKRPLNGRREAGLILNTIGVANGSYVNFTCNEYFERIGKAKLYCLNFEWENDIPECKLTNKICTEKPSFKVNMTQIVSLNRVELKIERNYSSADKLTIYTVSSYVCKPGSIFVDNFQTGMKYLNGTLLTYKNVTCIGPNTWEQIPQCILKN